MNKVGGSCPLKTPYGGMPSGGGYVAYTEYEIGAQMIAEAAHCILGSIFKGVTDDNIKERMPFEETHLREELSIILNKMREYSKPYYRSRFERWDEYTADSVKSILRNGPKLKAKALQKKSMVQRDDYPQSVSNAAMAAYDVIAALAVAMGKSVKNTSADNPVVGDAYSDPKLVGAVKKLQKAIQIMLKDDAMDWWESNPYRDEYSIEAEVLKVAKALLGSASGFMGEYNSKTHDNFVDPSMRVWSYADSDTGERLPLIMTELRKQKWDGKDVIWLSAIISPEKQGTGMASEILKMITAMADKHDVEIWLSPKPFGNVPNALSASKLKAWYKRYGWVKGDMGTMVRYPE
jgi:hypothetical protein